MLLCESISNFFIVNTKDKGMKSEVLLSKDFIDMKLVTTTVCQCFETTLFVLVCLLIKLHWNFKVCCLTVFFQF